MGNFPTEKTPQELLNFWTDYNVNPPSLVIGLLEWNGSGYVRKTSGLTAKKITVSGDITYVASAAIGSLQSAAVWQCKKIEVSGSNTIITWADGNSNFDNVATDLSTLTYS
jgi:hypothetical protein